MKRPKLRVRMQFADTGEEALTVRVDFGEARHLADLSGIEQDLKFAQQVLNRLFEHLSSKGDPDRILQRCYWTCALVSYARCFATGVRVGLKETEAFVGREKWLKAHEFFGALRDKHVAHSVNPYEDNITALVLTHPSSGEKRIDQVVTVNVAQYVPTVEQVRRFIALIEEVRGYVVREEKVWMERTREVASKQTPDELYRLEPPHVYAPAAGDHRRIRRG